MNQDYSEAALLKFLDYLLSKGLIKTATAKSRKIAAAKVLGALDDHEKLDLRTLDRELAFKRFVNKQGQGFTPDSLVTYKSRFSSSLDDFLRYVDNPAAFRPGVVSRAARKARDAGDSANNATPVRRAINGGGPESGGTLARISDPSTINFPVPIRPGVIVLISGLPGDLSPAEAQRIGAVVAALAVPGTQGGPK